MTLREITFCFQKKPSLPTVEERPPIWGQFHFFPNGVDSHLMNNPFPPGHAFPGQAPIVLLPSSYETEKDAEPSTSDGCFNAILLGGSLVLLGTISAAVALIFGFL